MKSKHKVFQFQASLPALGPRIHFFFGAWDEPALGALLKRKKIPKEAYSPEEYRALRGFNHRHSTVGASVVWLPKTPESAAEFAILVHELSHAIYHVNEYFGYNDEELTCTLLENFYLKARRRIEKYWKDEKQKNAEKIPEVTPIPSEEGTTANGPVCADDAHRRGIVHTENSRPKR